MDTAAKPPSVLILFNREEKMPREALILHISINFGRHYDVRMNNNKNDHC